MSGKVQIVHAVDTEGPLFESLSATFERLREIFGITHIQIPSIGAHFMRFGALK